MSRRDDHNPNKTKQESIQKVEGDMKRDIWNIVIHLTKVKGTGRMQNIRSDIGKATKELERLQLNIGAACVKLH